MLLNEIYKPDSYYKKVYRSFGVPLRTIWRATDNDFHNPAYINSYNGIWVGLTQNYPTNYGTNLGTTKTLMVPIMSTFNVSNRILNRSPLKYKDDDNEIPNETMKLKSSDLKQVIDTKMYINQEWKPYNKTLLYKLLINDPSVLQNLISTQEIEVNNCPNPECSTHKGSISTIRHIPGLCPQCLRNFGLDKILPKLKFDK